MSVLSEELKKIIKGEVSDAPTSLEAASRDASLFRVVPEVVVYPQDPSDVEALVQFVTLKKQVPKAHISLTARAAGTDMSGGPLNDSIIVDTTRHLNRVFEVSETSASVEPGVFFRDFDKETKKKGVELPSYTASRELNTVGGMVANNSGGEKNLKYGKTARYVEELDVVLADGKMHTLKKLAGAALQEKLIEQSFEGDIYRKVAALVGTPEHQRVIKAATPQVEKNSSGYALWDIGDGTTSLNLARLMVGAQGTLGLITRVKVGLVKPKPFAAMTVVFINSLAELGTIVPEALTHKPDSFESYDDHTFAIAVKYFPEFAAQMKSGIIGLGFSFLPEVFMALTGGIPKLILMIEFRSDSQEEALQKAEALAADIKNQKGKAKVRVAKNEKAARKFWVVRHESFSLLRKKVRGKRTAPFIDDFVVPPTTLPEFLPKLEAILSKYNFVYTIAGHVGDGNFHIIPLVDPKDPTVARVIDELSHKVYDLVLEYHGSISGEHNDGYIRTPYVEKMFGSEMYALFLETKKIFDPLNIFNPGKKVGTNFSDALGKLDLPTIQETSRPSVQKASAR
ncbi:MAG: FAD-binding oxidoreductase [Patescibacteria group bacterium]